VLLEAMAAGLSGCGGASSGRFPDIVASRRGEADICLTQKGLWCDRCHSAPPRTATERKLYAKMPSGSRAWDGQQPHASSTIQAVLSCGSREKWEKAF